MWPIQGPPPTKQQSRLKRLLVAGHTLLVAKVSWSKSGGSTISGRTFRALGSSLAIGQWWCWGWQAVLHMPHGPQCPPAAWHMFSQERPSGTLVSSPAARVNPQPAPAPRGPGESYFSTPSSGLGGKVRLPVSRCPLPSPGLPSTTVT